MNVVCLSMLGTGPGFVIQHITRAFPSTRVIRVIASRPPTTLRQRLRSFAKGGWLRRLENRCFYRGFYDRGDERVRRLLELDSSPPDWPDALEVSEDDLHAAATLEVIRGLQPDVIVVAGAPILKPKLFTIPRLGCINVHFGIAPDYRGENTLFWPMYFRDYDRVGVTIHRIDRGIDTGAVIVRGFVEVTPADDEWTLDAKAARLAASLVQQILEQNLIDRTLIESSRSGGRQFNFKARRSWHDAKLWLDRNVLRVGPGYLRERVEWNFSNVEQSQATNA